MIQKFPVSKIFLALLSACMLIMIARIFILQGFLLSHAEQYRQVKDYQTANAYINSAIQNIPFDGQARILFDKISIELDQDLALRKKLEAEKTVLDNNLRAELSALKLLLSKRDAHSHSDLQTIEYLQEQLALANQKLMDLLNQTSSYRSVLVEYEKTIAELQSELESLKRDTNAALRAKTELAVALESAKNNNTDLTEQLLKARKRIKELTDTIDAINAGNSLAQESRYQVSYLVENAEDRIAKNDSQGAKRLLDEALKSEPMNPRANMVLATLLLKENAFTPDSLKQIEFLLKRVTLSTGETPEVLVLKGNVQELQGKVDEAGLSYSQVLNKIGYNEKAMTGLFRILNQQNKWSEILTVSQPYEMAGNDRVYIFQARANAYHQLGQLTSEIGELKAGLDIKPGNLLFLKPLAMAYLKLKEYDECVTVLQEIIKRDSDFHNWETLAECYDALGKESDAFKAYEQAITNNHVTSNTELESQIKLCIAASKNRLNANDKNGAVYYYKKAKDYGVMNNEIADWGEYLAGQTSN